MKQAGIMLVINDEGKVLSISRRNDRTKIGLIGGKKDDNETVEQAAIRETFEEAGITVKSCISIFTRFEPRKDSEGEDFESHCFYALDWEGSPKDSDEGEVRWLTTSDLTGVNGAFAEYNKSMFEIFRKAYPQVYIKDY